MTEAGWTRNEDAAEAYADKAVIEAMRHVLGAHKLTCDEHENLQQDFKDVVQEAYQQGRVAGLLDAEVIAQFMVMTTPSNVAAALRFMADKLEAQQAQEQQGGDK